LHFPFDRTERPTSESWALDGDQRKEATRVFVAAIRRGVKYELTQA
jgi:hypothetical protein